MSEAAARRARTHWQKIVALSPAPLMIVLGSVAHDQASGLWDLPSAFETKDAVGDERRNLQFRVVGGTKRLIAYVPHSDVRTFRKFASLDPDPLSMLTDLVADRITVEDVERVLQS